MGWTGPKPTGILPGIIRGPVDDNLMSRACLTKSPKPNPVSRSCTLSCMSCLVETITLSLPDIRGALFWT